MAVTMTLRAARLIIGATETGSHPFGQTSKMPGYSYGLDAFACKRGSELAEVPGSVCAMCYARTNFYKTYKPVILNRQRHQAAVKHPLWADAMVLLMTHFLRDETVFRWHDSGDLVDVDHLGKICDVAARTPWLRHWLPTHEPRVLHAYLIGMQGPVPDNLTIRVSADMVGEAFSFPDDDVEAVVRLLTTSTVHRGVRPVQVSESRKDSVECRAHTRGNECGPCRACWSPKVKNVSYPAHGAGATKTAQHKLALPVVR